MRGRPAVELLRQSAPLAAAVVVLAAVPVASAGGPQPDRAPSSPAVSSPSAGSGGLAPDPVPGTSQAPPARSSVPVSRPAVVTPAVSPVAPVTHHTPTHTVVSPAKTKPKPKPHPHPVAPRPTRFVLPEIALPTLAAVGSARAPRDLDAVLAGLALLLAAVTAGSGARLVAVWNRRAGAA